VGEDRLEDKFDKLIESVKKELENILGTDELNIDRDKLWEIEYLQVNMRLVDAAIRSNPEALYVLSELRERVIDRRYHLTDEYYEKKKEIDQRYEEQLRKLSKQAASSEMARQRYMFTLFEWIMKRLELQDDWVKRHSPIKIVASAFLGGLDER